MSDREEKACDVVALVSELATKAFAEHRLSWDAETMSWRCDARFHWFRVYFAPCRVFVWGDIGDFVLAHGDSDSMGWFLAQGEKDERYCDYFLGKLKASEYAVREFFIGDAEAYLDARIAEDNETDWRGLRLRFREERDEETRSASSCWQLAWMDVIGDCDAPRCEGWSASSLWLWHAARTFARLFNAAKCEYVVGYTVNEHGNHDGEIECRNLATCVMHGATEGGVRACDACRGRVWSEEPETKCFPLEVKP